MARMRERLLGIALAALAAAAPAAAQPSGASAPSGDGYKVVGYYVSWGAYGRAYTPRNIDATKLTHINYAFARIENGGLTLGDPLADPKNFAELQRLKDQNQTLKLLVSVGGWDGSKDFSEVASTEASRHRFAEAAVAFLRGHGFDGIDIDWEYPVAGGKDGNVVRTEDKTNFTRLLEALRSSLDAAGRADGRRYLLTIATGAAPERIASVELDKVSKVVDWVNIMTYDFNGPWSRTSGHNSPLFADPADPSPAGVSNNVAAAVEAHLNAGVPATKLVLGLPSYGRTWTGCAAPNNGQYQLCAGPAKGTWEDGSIDYTDIEENYLTDRTFVRRFNEAAKVPFLFNATSGQFISYDDGDSFRHKIAFVRANGLGGAMSWELTADRKGSLLALLARELLPASR